MDSSYLAIIAVAWLATYAVHSSVLLGGAFLLDAAGNAARLELKPDGGISWLSRPPRPPRPPR